MIHHFALCFKAKTEVSASFRPQRPDFLPLGIDGRGKKGYTTIVLNISPGCCAVGSAPALGAGGREFESRHSDIQKHVDSLRIGVLFCLDKMSCEQKIAAAGKKLIT